ncbi:MAG: sigma-70 family RNA polymerase sigma factor [Planctomycetes bacterium]|nr:sigma-70 family RNA polymerase sigma factor [Planctomycetota bacterium]
MPKPRSLAAKTDASGAGETSAQSSTDKSLLRRFREGNQDAATALYVRYAKRLQALAKAQTGEQLASRFDPEDVVQSVFRTFFRRAVDTGYDVPAGDELWQLLLVMALNKIRTLATHHRAQKRDVARTGNPKHFEQLYEGSSGQDEVAYETMRMVVEELVADLPAPKNRIVELRIEGHEVQQIAKETKRSMRTVERTLQQFRSRLAKLIDDEV